MKIQELLFEMPRTINPTDFNLSDSFTKRLSVVVFMECVVG